MIGRIVISGELVVELGKDHLQLLRDGKPQTTSVLQDRHTLISFLLVNFSRRDSAIIESFDRKNINKFHTTLNMKKSSQPTNFSVG